MWKQGRGYNNCKLTQQQQQRTQLIRQTNAADTKEGGHKFGYTYWAASDFFSTIGDTLTEIAKENGDEVIVVDAQQDQSKQISIIEDFITQGVDAVFLNPVDPRRH